MVQTKIRVFLWYVLNDGVSQNVIATRGAMP